MTRRNRVDPSGELTANPSKAALLMGNRGRLHDNHGQVVKKMIGLKRWISCTKEERFGHRKLMQPNSYTELFFLDEATAMAAGHRPCAECRGPAYKRFGEAWLKAGLSTKISADAIDKTLDAERRSPETRLVGSARLPGGTMVKHPTDSTFYLVYAQQLYPWSFSGYGTPTGFGSEIEDFVLVTPPSMVRLLEAGYKPCFHDSLSRLDLCGTLPSGCPSAPPVPPGTNSTRQNIAAS